MNRLLIKLMNFPTSSAFAFATSAIKTTRNQAVRKETRKDSFLATYHRHAMYMLLFPPQPVLFFDCAVYAMHLAIMY
jgi:hypothetical protein